MNSFGSSPSATLHAIARERTAAIAASYSDVFMPVSGRLVVEGLPAYTGGRRLDLEHHCAHAPRSRGSAPGAQGRESGGRHAHAGKALARMEVRA